MNASSLVRRCGAVLVLFGLLLGAPVWAGPSRDEIAGAEKDARASEDENQRSELYLRLGELYFDAGQTANALAAYQMVERESDAYRDALWGRARCHVRRGSLQPALQALTELASIAKQDALLATRLDTANKVRLVWRDIITIAAQRGDPDQARVLFHQHGDANVLWRIADFYREQGKPDDSSETYRQLIFLDGDALGTCEWQDEIARNSLGPGAKGQGKDLPEPEKAMLDAYAGCIERVSHRVDTVELQYHRARVYYEHDLFAEAQPLFEDIVNRHRDYPRLAGAVTGLLVSLTGQGKTDAVVQWADKLRLMKELAKDPGFDRRVRLLVSEAHEANGRTSEQKRDYKSCGRSMAAAADTQPENPKHAERLWHAGLCFERAHMVGQALKARQQLVKDHPSDPLAREALFKIAGGRKNLRYD